MEQNLIITGAYENNLKHLSVEIPKGKLVVVTGVSGSGKSSLVFDIIAAEAQRQLGETLPAAARSRMPRYEEPHVQSIEHLSPAVVIRQQPFSGDIRSTVGTMCGAAPMLRLLFSRCAHPRLSPSSAYSCNDPQGMCPVCSGLGHTVVFDHIKLFDPEKSLNEGAIRFPGHQVGSYQWQLYANSGFLDPDKPLKQYSEQEWEDFLHGSGKIVEIRNTTGTVWKDYQLTYEGFLDRINRLYLKRDPGSLNKTGQRVLNDFTQECACPACKGMRLNDAALNSRLCGCNIAEMGNLEITQLISLLESIQDPVGQSAAKQIVRILQGIEEIGLGYLNLNRPSRSLSGGESQRLRIVRHLGSSLTGLMYLFDEPSAGLHAKDVEQLGRLLLHLRDNGNTVLAVEHNRQLLRLADHVIDIGPAAGRQGGQVVFEGTPEALSQAGTPTAAYFKESVILKTRPRTPKGWVTLQNACLHNLKQVSVCIPEGVLTVVSGVAGSGKSSLCTELLRQFPEAIHISQSPIGTTARSTPATYTGVMDEIRRLFARENGVDAALFSYNSKGACPACAGKGVIKTEMAFMDPVEVPCEVCHGTRYSSEALQYRYQGKDILEVLSMTIEEALSFFDSPKIRNKLRVLSDVGMGYMTLGQPTDTLSGGECQRIKLASCLQKKSAVYVLDEPAIGLHGKDIACLLGVLDRLADKGNTLIVTEHNLNMIAHADWVVDLGPGGGKHGGEILFSGTLEQLLACKKSATAEALREAAYEGPSEFMQMQAGAE